MEHIWVRRGEFAGLREFGSRGNPSLSGKGAAEKGAFEAEGSALGLKPALILRVLRDG